MAAFSYQYHPFLFDPVLCTHDSYFKFSGFVAEGQINPTTMTTAENCLSQIYPSEAPRQHQQVQVPVDVGGVIHESSSLSSKVDNEPSVTTKTQTPESSSVMDKPDSGEQVNQKMSNKRKSRALNSAQSKDAREGKDKKQRKFNGGLSDKMLNTAEKNQKEGPEEEKGYIHVRARRGQATDSHSLAERVRRERISERMKLLQAIVPGCDKITGKALMLDEIINYVQSLQHQVEFLSLKLASLNPLFYDFGMDMNAMNIRQETLSSLAPSTLPSGHQISPTQPQPASFLDNISPNFTTAYSQDNGSFMWGLEDDQTQKFINPFGLTNGMSSFH